MSVDEPAVARGDQQMNLKRASTDKGDITRSERWLGSGETIGRREWRKVGQGAVMKAVVIGKARLHPAALQSRCQQADTVEPTHRIAPMKPERRADERLGGGGKIFAAHPAVAG